MSSGCPSVQCGWQWWPRDVCRCQLKLQHCRNWNLLHKLHSLQLQLQRDAVDGRASFLCLGGTFWHSPAAAPCSCPPIPILIPIPSPKNRNGIPCPPVRGALPLRALDHGSCIVCYWPTLVAALRRPRLTGPCFPFWYRFSVSDILTAQPPSPLNAVLNALNWGVGFWERPLHQHVECPSGYVAQIVNFSNFWRHSNLLMHILHLNWTWTLNGSWHSLIKYYLSGLIHNIGTCGAHSLL